MVLAVEDPDFGHADCALLNPSETLEVGTNLTCADKTANNQSTINYKKFSKVKMTAKDGKIFCGGEEIEGISPDKGFKGRVC